MDGFDPDFLPADPAAIAKARADALARRRTAPLDPNSPEAQYAPEAENLGALRFLNAVPFGTQLAAGAKALGERVRGETDDFDRSYDYHRQRNEEALKALAEKPTSVAWDAAGMIPYALTGPAGGALYAGAASATRGDSPVQTALEAAANVIPTHGPSGPLMAAPIVFHGSPHVFDKFSMQKIGTGEGAQAYGHGLYFTSEPKVAEGYRSNLAERTLRYANGVDIPAVRADVKRQLAEAADRFDAAGKPNDAYAARAQIKFMNAAEESGAHLADPDLSSPWTMRGVLKNYGDAHNSIEHLIERPDPGAFYHADIPDNLLPLDQKVSQMPPEMLQRLEAGGFLPKGSARYAELGRGMDAISEQPIPKGANAVEESARRKAAWDTLNAERKQIAEGFRSGNRLNFDSPDILFGPYGYKGEDVYRDAHSDPAKASESLRRAGFAGHSYIGDSSGVRNYVMYDDAPIKVLGRYPSLAEYEAAARAEAMAKAGKPQ